VVGNFDVDNLTVGNFDVDMLTVGNLNVGQNCSTDEMCVAPPVAASCRATAP
jgi:hypothetical protein